MRYKTVVFDLDGTLVETRPGIEGGLRHALRELGLPQPDEARIRAMIGPPLAEGFGRIEGLAHADVGRAVELYRDYYASQGIFEAYPYPGIPELLRDLRAAGVLVRVATLKASVFAERVLAHLELLPYVDKLCGPDLGEMKDIKEQLVRMAVFGAPAPAAMVGDRRGDLMGARAAGVDGIAALYGYGGYDELAACEPAAMAKDVEELRAILL